METTGQASGRGLWAHRHIPTVIRWERRQTGGQAACSPGQHAGSTGRLGDALCDAGQQHRCGEDLGDDVGTECAADSAPRAGCGEGCRGSEEEETGVVAATRTTQKTCPGGSSLGNRNLGLIRFCHERCSDPCRDGSHSSAPSSAQH